jgi:hypothetical protein
VRHILLGTCLDMTSATDITALSAAVDPALTDLARRFDPSKQASKPLSVSSLTVSDFAEKCGALIVRAGHTTHDTEGRHIYSKRVDYRLPAVLYDPMLRRDVAVRVRVRVTVEFAPIEVAKG